MPLPRTFLNGLYKDLYVLYDRAIYKDHGDPDFSSIIVSARIRQSISCFEVSRPILKRTLSVARFVLMPIARSVVEGSARRLEHAEPADAAIPR